MVRAWIQMLFIAGGCLLVTFVHGASPAVVAGDVSAAVLASDGRVLTWGLDDSGVLGSGRLLIQSTFAEIPGLNLGAGVSQDMVAATSHVVLVDAQGRVWGWGDNTSGQLGDGTSLSRTRPAQITGISDVRAVAAAYDASIFLKSDGSVWSTVAPTGEIKQVKGLAAAISVAAGATHGVALKSDGTVWTWGINYNGALGNGSATVSFSDPLQANQVPGISGATAIAAGYYNTFAVLADGTVRGWGINDFGQLLDGTTTTRYAPVLLAGLDDVKQISIKSGQMYALKRDGTVWNWGSTGQTLPTRNSGPSGVIWIEANAGDGYLALTADGTLWAQGSNRYGEFGDGTTSYRAFATPVQGIPTPAAFVAGWGNTVLVRTDGTVWVAGSNAHGQSGLETNLYRSTPTTIPGLDGVVAFSTGGSSTYPCTVALTGDGKVWGWGAGQCLGTSEDQSSPVTLPAFAGAVAVSVGMNSTMALQSDGSVWMQGSNSFGQRGNGSTAFSAPGTVPGLADVASITAGSNFNFAITRDGTLWAWGKNDRGQLGDGTTTDRYQPVAVGPGFRSVTAGAMHVLAVKSDGTLWAWGWNGYGQVGDGTETTRTSPVQIGTGFQTVGAGVYYSAALKTDGSLWGWGSNGAGAPGTGAGVDTNVPLQIGTGYIAFAVGKGGAQSDYIVALKADGTVWAWGANPYGQLGDGTFVGHAGPATVVNEAVTGVLDLISDVANSIPGSAAPKIVLEARRLGGIAGLTLGSNVYFGAIDLGALAGTFSADGPYKVFVAAMVPAGISGILAGLYLLSRDGWSYYNGGPLREYVTNATLDATQHAFVSIVENADLRGLIGTRIFVGYGTSDDEMLATGRYREIYAVQLE